MAQDKGWWNVSIENLEEELDTEEGERRWVVFVEEHNGQTAHWVGEAPRTSYGTREEARAAALRTAREHLPPRPASPRDRTVIRHDEDGYTVLVKGMTSTWRFRVSVGEVLP